jgi:hypothetical protein
MASAGSTTCPLPGKNHFWKKSFTHAASPKSTVSDGNLHPLPVYAECDFELYAGSRILSNRPALLVRFVSRKKLDKVIYLRPLKHQFVSAVLYLGI